MFVLLVCSVAGCAGAPAVAGRRASAAVSAQPETAVSPDVTLATVGALFDGRISAGHGCTASVVNSPGQDLILTAAHCITGTGAGMSFVPDYHDGVAPDGVWTVQDSFADPAWINGQSATSDYAILRMTDQSRAGEVVGVQAVTGANQLTLMPAAGQAITVIAYNAGVNDEPLRCATTVRYESGYPTFDCAGFSSGTSGGAWLTRVSGHNGYVVGGVIGGLHQGGCIDSTSYSPPFGPAILQLLARAAANQAPDTFPSPGGSGC